MHIQNIELKEWFTIRSAAAKIDRSEAAVRALIQKKKIKSIIVEGRRQIHIEEIKRLMRGR